MKKILIITEHYWPENFRINDLSIELQQNGISIDVLTGYPNYPEGNIYDGYSNMGWKKDIFKDINIFRVPIIPRKKGTAFLLMLNYLSFIISASFRLIFLKKDYDHIFVFESSPITVCLPAIFAKKILRYKAPISMWVLDLWPDYFFDTLKIKRNPIIGSFLDTLCKFIYKNCDNILLISEGFQNSVKRLVPNHNGLIYFPNWAEKIFEDSTKDYSVKSKKRKILFAGNVGRLQNLENLILAFYDLKKLNTNINELIELEIVGDGSAKKSLEKIVKEKNLDDIIKFTGSLPLEKMPEIYQTADFLYISLIPGGTFDKTIPGKLQSYMACGVPVVGCIGGETYKLLNSINNEFVVLTDEYEKLKDMLLYCIEVDETTLKEYGRDLKRYYFKNFSRKRAIDACLKIFNIN